MTRGRLAPLWLVAALLGPPATGAADAQDAPAPRGRDALIRYAESLLVRDYRREYTTEDFDVVSDSPDGAAASILAANFEAVFHVLGSLLPLPPGSEPERGGRISAYLFQSRRQYERFEAFVQNGQKGRSSGMYFAGYGILAFHLEMYVQPAVRTVMLHECVHAYVDRRLRARSDRFPSCLDEGLAEYVALSEVEDGRIKVGSYAAKMRYDTPYGKRKLPTIAAERLSAARRAARWRKGELSLDYLFRTTVTGIGNEDRAGEYYAACWLLVDYLRHGRPDGPERRFPEMLARVEAGQPAVEVMESVYGLPASDLERGFREYVKDFKLPRRRPAEPPR